jgi:2-iminobutanoate/2-iminopropanoate deaminase
MTIKRIDLSDPEWGFTFSTCVVAGDFIFTSHIAGHRDEERNGLETIEEQTEQCFRNLERALEAAGASLDDVVKTTVYLKTLEDFHGMREVYRRQFSDGYPARMTATSEFLDAEIRVMIEAVAYRPGQE